MRYHTKSVSTALCPLRLPSKGLPGNVPSLYHETYSRRLRDHRKRRQGSGHTAQRRHENADEMGVPRGKIDNGESAEECPRREVSEEIGVTANAVRALAPQTHRYDTFLVTLYPFTCTISSGEIILREHAALKWLKPEELHVLDWVDADPSIIDAYRESFNEA
jgi:mutator protein MutT